jgi:hypothetical protein
MNMLKILGLAAVVVGASSAQAGMVVWDLTGQPGDELSVPVASVPTGLFASDLTRGPGLTPAVGVNSINSSGFEDQAVPDPDEFYEFTVGGGGSPLSLASLAYTDNRSATGPFGVRVAFSLDGFGTSTLLGQYSLLPETNTRQTFDLTGIAELQRATSPVTFRVFAFGADSLAGTYGLGTEPFFADNNLPANVVITTLDVAAVPEPGTMLLALVGLPMVLWASRRVAR